MAINIEVKQRLKAIEDRLKALEDGREKLMGAVVQLVDSALLSSKPMDVPKLEQNVQKITGDLSWKVGAPKEKNVKLCPKCQKVPGYFFHVRSCKGP